MTKLNKGRKLLFQCISLDVNGLSCIVCAVAKNPTCQEQDSSMKPALIEAEEGQRRTHMGFINAVVLVFNHVQYTGRLASERAGTRIRDNTKRWHSQDPLTNMHFSYQGFHIR